MDADEKAEKAKKNLTKYTLAATATGAISVPVASVAIVAENSAMIAHIAGTMGE
jgi:hypothetical protein